MKLALILLLVVLVSCTPKPETTSMSIGIKDADSGKLCDSIEGGIKEACLSSDIDFKLCEQMKELWDDHNCSFKE